MADSPDTSTKTRGNGSPANSVGVCSIVCRKSTESAEVNKATLAFNMGVSITFVSLLPLEDFGFGDFSFFGVRSFGVRFFGEVNQKPIFVPGKGDSTEDSTVEATDAS